MEKVLVVGAAGFLGTNLARLLLEYNRLDGELLKEVRLLDRIQTNTTGYKPNKKTKVVSFVGDITDLDSLKDAFAGVDTVFHLASVVDVNLKPNPVIERVNVGGTRNVIRACHQAGVRRLIYTSSEDVVLSEIPRHNADETVPYPKKPVHDYVRTKITAEKLALQANGVNKLLTCALRPVHLYGPGDPHAIKRSIEVIRAGKLPFLLGDGSARFGIVYIDNIAHAHILAAQKLATHDDPHKAPAGEAYFIGEDNAVNYFDFLKPYVEAKGLKLPRWRLPNFLVYLIACITEILYRILSLVGLDFDPPFHRFHCYVICQDFNFSHAKATRDFGYKPIVNKVEAVQRTVDWVRTQDV